MNTREFFSDGFSCEGYVSEILVVTWAFRLSPTFNKRFRVRRRLMGMRIRLSPPRLHAWLKHRHRLVEWRKEKKNVKLWVGGESSGDASRVSITELSSTYPGRNLYVPKSRLLSRALKKSYYDQWLVSPKFEPIELGRLQSWSAWLTDNPLSTTASWITWGPSEPLISSSHVTWEHEVVD